MTPDGVLRFLVVCYTPDGLLDSAAHPTLVNALVDKDAAAFPSAAKQVGQRRKPIPGESEFFLALPSHPRAGRPMRSAGRQFSGRTAER